MLLKPVGGKLPRLSKDELERMTPTGRLDYHTERMRVFTARAMFCAKLAIGTACLAIGLAIVSLILHVA